MQTILKCASLGGSLLEKSKETRLGASDEFDPSLPIPVKATPPTPLSAEKKHLRPILENRAITTSGPINHGSTESPSIVSEQMPDPLERVGIKASSAIISLTEVDPTPVT